MTDSSEPNTNSDVIPLLRTPLYQAHVAAGARLVPFAGWEMPLHYGSQLNEHHIVRQRAGMFDVSHMAIFDISGAAARDLLQRVVANDVDRLDGVGKALYGVALNPQGGVIDDLIVYRLAEGYRVVSNAGTRDRVRGWLAACNTGAARIEEQPLAMIAVQGPEALKRFAEALARVHGAQSDRTDWTSLPVFSAEVRGDWMIARTGYTGEDGLEVMLPAAAATGLWETLRAVGVEPIGLGARDTLRLEAGLNLYGQDMDEATGPLVANLGWTIAWQPEARAFIGREAVARDREQGVPHRLTGLVLEGRGVVRHGQTVRTEAGFGVITSGIFSPTLGYSIALARVPRAARGGCEVEIRGKWHPARLVKPPFVRNGARVFV
jgi:aminomethyltransferase